MNNYVLTNKYRGSYVWLDEFWLQHEYVSKVSCQYVSNCTTLFYCISWHYCKRCVTRQLTHLQRRKLVDIPGSQKLLLQPCCPSSLSYVWISGRSTLPHAFVLIDLSIFRSVYLLNYFYLVPLRIILTSELPVTISPYTIRRRGCVSPAAGSDRYYWKAADFTVVKWNNWDECIFTFFGATSAQSYVFLGTP